MHFSTIAFAATLCSFVAASPVNHDKPAAVPKGYFSLYAYTADQSSPGYFTHKPVRPYGSLKSGNTGLALGIDPQDTDDWNLPQYRIINGALEVSGFGTQTPRGMNPFVASLDMGGKRGGVKKSHRILFGREGQGSIRFQGKQFPLSHMGQFGITVDTERVAGDYDKDGRVYALTYGGKKDVFVLCGEIGQHGDVHLTREKLWDENDVENCRPIVIDLWFSGYN